MPTELIQVISYHWRLGTNLGRIWLSVVGKRDRKDQDRHTYMSPHSLFSLTPSAQNSPSRLSTVMNDVTCLAYNFIHVQHPLLCRECSSIGRISILRRQVQKVTSLSEIQCSTTHGSGLTNTLDIIIKYPHYYVQLREKLNLSESENIAIERSETYMRDFLVSLEPFFLSQGHTRFFLGCVCCVCVCVCVCFCVCVHVCEKVFVVMLVFV